MKSKKKSLGRGLDAILQSPETDITARDISGDYVAGAIASIRAKQIESNPFQPRTDFEAERLAELADSMKQQGIIQPLTVRKLGYDRYQLIAGERRLRAAEIAGLREVPCYIRVANDEQMLEMALIENIHREDLNPVDIAISYQRLMEECNLTQDSLSGKVGKDRATISNYIRLLKLPVEIQLALKNRKITMGHARALIALPDAESQLKMLHIILQKDLSVRDVENLSRLAKQKTEKKMPVSLPPKFSDARDSLKEQLNTAVQIQQNNNGKGSIVIKFNSESDLERILDILRKS